MPTRKAHRWPWQTTAVRPTRPRAPAPAAQRPKKRLNRPKHLRHRRHVPCRHLHPTQHRPPPPPLPHQRNAQHRRPQRLLNTVPWPLHKLRITSPRHRRPRRPKIALRNAASPAPRLRQWPTRRIQPSPRPKWRQPHRHLWPSRPIAPGRKQSPALASKWCWTVTGVRSRQPSPLRCWQRYARCRGTGNPPALMPLMRAVV